VSFDDLLKTLQEDYLKSLPEKIKIITAQVQANDASNVRESFHKLKGTGKTYGFPEVSELAEVVENICIVQPGAGLNAARQAIPVLEDIHRVRQQASSYPVAADVRVAAIRKLLPS
jgi:HPt (histidine-containing phosphotransfer) domain-containing protein